ncbi:MAG: adenylosuccinate synthase [Clostridia bacterium]|nr:adenylosuccinate synthase [Clostridia bacterium]
MVKAIVGGNWGDEGKGKITDMFAKDADIVIRFQGGANAGHTIINDYGRFALHTLPSGVCNPDTVNIIGNGVAFDVERFLGEVEQVVSAGVPQPKILISERAQVVMPYHVLFDCYEEERLGKEAFGSTHSGIAPFFADKVAKIGFQVCELYDDEYLKAKIARVIEPKNLQLQHIYHKPLIDGDELYNTLVGWREKIKPFVVDTNKYLREALAEGKDILLEGQLGTLKDTDSGIYPMVTSSSSLAAYGAVGAAGIPPYAIQDVIVVTKAYSSAVGAGEFTSEILDEEEAQELRLHGGDKGEFGATTGRPRRVGWFDAVATRYGVQTQGATEVVVTALDCLSYLEELKICVAYDIDGEITRDFPVTPRLKKAKPVYKTFKGWHCDIRGIRDYDKLPQETRDYIEFIEQEIGAPVTMVSNGPAREEIIFRNK